MPHILAAPPIVELAVTIGRLLVLIFRKRVLKRAPVSVARLSLRGDRVVPNTIVGVTVFGVTVVGILIVLRGGLQLF
jgi:hypothetical protein